MKFRDPKTGEVFEGIKDAYSKFCCGRDCDTGCPLDAFKVCNNWSFNHPAEAARRMGFEVVEDESTMSQVTQAGQSTKPHICEVLGVEVGERFRVESDDCCLYPEAYVDDDEIVRASVGYAMDGMRLCQIIKGELRIIRKPRFTEEEAEDAKALVRILGATQIKRTEYGGNLHAAIGDIAEVVVNQDLFPSLRSGQAVKLEDVIHATDR